MNLYKMLSFVGLWKWNHRPNFSGSLRLPKKLVVGRTSSLWPKIPLHIHDFREVRHVSSEMLEPNEHFVYRKPGGIMLEYYTNQDVKIGYVRYYITTGQIGLFFIDEEYQRRGLGKQILSKVIQDLEAYHCDEVWVVTTTNHSFWSNVYNKSFVPRNPAHRSVGGSGYVMKITNDI